jgi:hypothetical protein
MNTPGAANFLPPYLVPLAAQTDLSAYNQIEMMLARLDSIRYKLDAHRTLAGAEAYRTSLTFFQLAKAAAVAGIPGAQAVVDALAPRFAEQGGGAPQQPAP